MMKLVGKPGPTGKSYCTTDSFFCAQVRWLNLTFLVSLSITRGLKRYYKNLHKKLFHCLMPLAERDTKPCKERSRVLLITEYCSCCLQPAKQRLIYHDPRHHVMGLPCCTLQDSSAARKTVLYCRSLLSHPLQTTAKFGQRSPVTGVQSVQLCAERASTLNLWSPYRCSSVSSFQSLAARHVSHSPVMTTGSRGRSNRSTNSSTLSSCLGATPARAIPSATQSYHDCTYTDPVPPGKGPPLSGTA